MYITSKFVIVYVEAFTKIVQLCWLSWIFLFKCRLRIMVGLLRSPNLVAALRFETFWETKNLIAGVGWRKFYLIR